MGPIIKKAVLLDERRIELYWDRQVWEADVERNFRVTCKGEELPLTHWTNSCDQEWDYGTVYQKESMRTTLALTEPLDGRCAKDLQVSLTGEVVDLEDHPADYGTVYPVVYEPYYTSWLKTETGITVRAGCTVAESSLQLAARIIDLMLKKIPDVAAKLIELHADVGIYGLKENAYDIPEHRMGYLLATRHVEGFGGVKGNPISTISEANLIRLRSGRYATMYPHEMILVHEFGHAIHLIGIDYLEDKTLSNRIKDCYEHAKNSGLWPDTYAISNHEEYFATMSTIWFNVMQEGVDGKWDGIRGPVNTREELRIYDPEAYCLMRDIYMEDMLPAPWNYNTDFYDCEGKPRQEMGCYNLGLDKFEWQFIK